MKPRALTRTRQYVFPTHLQQEVDLFPGGAHQAVEAVQPLGLILQAEQCVFLAFPSVKDRDGPSPRAALDFLYVVLGSLKSALQVTNRVAYPLDVLPNACREAD